MPAVTLDSTDAFLANDSGDVIVHAAQIEQSKVRATGFHVYQDIELATPFPTWGFLSADKFDFPDSWAEFVKNIDHHDKVLIKPLYKEHQDIYKLFKKQKVNKILDFEKLIRF